MSGKARYSQKHREASIKQFVVLELIRQLPVPAAYLASVGILVTTVAKAAAWNKKKTKRGPKAKQWVCEHLKRQLGVSCTGT